MPAARTDFLLTQWARWRAKPQPATPRIRWLDTAAGSVRAFDSGGDGPCIVFTPDGPNVIEHHLPVLDRLAPEFRVVCFDMPGFGLSWPSAAYAHSLDEGARAVLSVLDALHIAQATLAFSCANGLYALRVARLAPQRVRSLRRIAGHALRCGGCFSLAGVVQGLVRESEISLTGAALPCTLLWGGADRTHRATPARSLLALVPHADVVLAGDCGHFPDLEQPERYLQLLRQHLAQLPAHH
jgi:pimeloyl-ACP methyl ester carboxylesterase